MSISVPSNATTVDRIRQIHGSAVANELVELAVSDEKLAFKAIGWITNANYHVKRMALLLFINHRSVESGAMKKAMTSIYSLFLPKGGHPFIYLSLEIDPQRVDVNVHPTKREVNFLNEDDIIGMISRSIQAQLSKVDTSRTFMVQSLLPGAGSNTPNPTRSKDQMSSNRKTTRAPENSLVRTDPSLRKITSMLPSSGNLSDPATSMDLTYTSTDREPIAMRLVTVKELRAEVRNQVHGGLTEVFASHTYVGLVDTARRIVAIQSGVKLYLVDYGMVCNEYFYQIGLTHFANFGVMKFETPLDIKKLINVAVDSEKQTVSPTAGPMQSEPIDWSQIAPRVTAQLVQHREMLLEYFNLDVSQDGQLHSLPLLAKGYMPSLAKLPRFLMRLGPCVDWKDEKGCFHTFLVELASFYTPEQLPQERRKETAGPSDQLAANGHEPSQAEDPEIRLRRDQMARMLEHVLFPAFRARLVATKGLLRGVVEVADLKGLYRVFERC
jgi:DNA mismatch repair protein MLH1